MIIFPCKITFPSFSFFVCSKDIWILFFQGWIRYFVWPQKQMLLTSRACQLNPRDQNCDFSDTWFVTLGLFIHRDECISMHKQAFGGLLQGTRAKRGLSGFLLTRSCLSCHARWLVDLPHAHPWFSFLTSLPPSHPSLPPSHLWGVGRAKLIPLAEI